MYKDVKRMKSELVILEEMWSLDKYTHILQGGKSSQTSNRT